MRIAFTSAGAPRHGQNLCKLIQGLSDERGWGWECFFYEWAKDGYESLPLEGTDWIWNCGNFGNVFHWFADLNGVQTVAQWIGTDILSHGDAVSRGALTPFRTATIHIADASNLQEEARQLTGLDVGLVRSIPPETYDTVPIGRWDGVLGYVPTGRDDFFRWAWFLELARDYPEITFHIIGREGDKELPTNVYIHKEISGDEKKRLFESCFAYLRPIQHDGIGLTLIEMAQLGRFVFHTDTRIPYVYPARSIGEMEFHMDEILRRKQQPDQEISKYYVREFSKERLGRDVEELRRAMDDNVRVPP